MYVKTIVEALAGVSWFVRDWDYILKTWSS